MGINSNMNDNKLYVLPRYRVYFDDEIATKYKPIVYSHECLSGDPAEHIIDLLQKMTHERHVYSISFTGVIKAV